MVLAELGAKIAGAISSMANATIVDETVLNDMLKDIARALVEADVNVKQVMALRDNIRKAVNLDELAAGVNHRRVIEKAVFDEMCKLVTSEKKPYKPVKGRTNVFMFVGLQGSGKTTSITKLAYHYKSAGWKTALVCADTFRAGAFDQLKQNATKVKVPFYGSYTETDPVRAADEGVRTFRQEGYEIIIVDTSGRHSQEEELFEEMRRVYETVQPDSVVFVLDAHIGQAAFDQAKAFNATVDVGSVIVTKLDGHAKGGGALSAVAATNSPIIFLGTGEHHDDFEPFVAASFVSRLLGIGDMDGFLKKVQGLQMHKQPELLENIEKGNFTLRLMRTQFEMLLSMGPLSKVMGMLPGFREELLPKGREAESVGRIKRFMCIMDSMTNEELDATNFKFLANNPNRLLRISRGCGRHPAYIEELLIEFKRLQGIVKVLPKSMMGGKGGRVDPRQMNASMANVSKMLPPQVMAQMGGVAGLQNLMKQMTTQMGGKGGGSMQEMMRGMGLG